MKLHLSIYESIVKNKILLFLLKVVHTIPWHLAAGLTIPPLHECTVSIEHAAIRLFPPFCFWIPFGQRVSLGKIKDMIPIMSSSRIAIRS